MTAAAMVLLAATAWLLGWALLRLLDSCPSDPSPVLELVTGLLLLHLLLTALQKLGIPWSRGSVGMAAAVVAAGLAFALRHRRPAPAAPLPAVAPGRQDRWGWGDAVALMAVAGFAAAAISRRATHPDFIFHWAIKGKKFLLAGGVDFGYLAHPWNHYAHPDYPNLLPELYAVTSLFGGRFQEPALLGWSVLFFGGLAFALREGLRRGAVASVTRQAGLAAITLGSAAFSIGYLQAGGADLMIALALLLGLPALVGEAARGDDLAVGVAAAFAAASKIEGVPLGGFLVGMALLGGFRQRNLSAAAIARMVVPGTLVVLPWVIDSLRFGLFQPTNTGSLDLSRWKVVGSALAASFAVPQWHGFAYLVLALPLLLAVRRGRAMTGVLLLQLGFYLAIYFTTPMDVDFYIRSSFPRLLFHLLPSVSAVVLLALDAWSQRAAPTDSERTEMGGGGSPPPG